VTTKLIKHRYIGCSPVDIDTVKQVLKGLSEEELHHYVAELLSANAYEMNRNMELRLEIAKLKSSQGAGPQCPAQTDK
jgi:hypothetical protein